MKKFLKITGFFIGGIVLALALVPYIFKDKIVALVKEGINQNLNAQVEFDEIDLSLLRSFPKARLTVTNLSVIGIDTFDAVPLFNAKSVFVETNLTPLFNDKVKPVISYFEVNEADINLIVMNNMQANYLITKPSSDTSQIVFDISSYAINNSKLTYTDYTIPLEMKLNGVNHSGTGAVVGNVYDLITKTKANQMTVTYDGATYLKEVPTAFDAGINIDLDKEKYTFTNLSAKLKDLLIIGEGSVAFDGEDMIIKLAANAPKATLNEIVAVLPMLKQDKTYKAAGDLVLNLKVDGRYNSITGNYPAFDIVAKIKDGFLKYTELPYPLKPAQLDMQISSTKPKMQDLVVKIPSFSFGVNNDKIAGDLLLDRKGSSPQAKGNIKGTMNLANWAKALPLENVQALSGLLNADVSFDAILADIEKGIYTKAIFKGALKIVDLKYKTNDMPALEVNQFNASASPQLVTISSEGTKLGSSGFNLSGQVQDPLFVFSSSKPIKGQFKLNSDYIDLDEFASQNTTPSSTATAVPAPIDLSKYQNSNIALIIDLKKVKYDDKNYENIKVNGNVSPNAMQIDQLSAQLGSSDFALTGVVENGYDYFFNNKELRGDLVLKSNYLDANQFMTQEASGAPLGNMPVPSNVKLNLNAIIGTLIYTNLTIKNIDGKMIVSDQQALMNGIAGDVLGGKIGFDGFYATKDIKSPDFNIKLDLSKIKMEEAYDKFVSIKAFAPVAKYIKGYFNTTLVMSGKLDTAMTPHFQSLNASGFIETINSAIKNSKILDQISDKLGVEALKNIDLETSRNWFEVVDGKLELKEKAFKIKDIDAKIAGTHTLFGPMDYTLMLKVPRTYLRSSDKLKVVDSGLSWLSKEASRLGVDVANGEFLDIKVAIGGLQNAPTFKITPLGSSGKTFKEELNDKANAVVEKAKDSISTVLNDKKQQLEDTVRTRLNDELEKAKDKVLSEAEQRAKEAADKARAEIKKEIGNRIDSTIGGAVSDSIRLKAEQVLKDKTGTEIKDIKKKIEDFNPFKKKKNGGN